MKCDICGKEITKKDILTEFQLPYMGKLKKLNAHALCYYQVMEFMKAQDKMFKRVKTVTIDSKNIL